MRSSAVMNVQDESTTTQDTEINLEDLGLEAEPSKSDNSDNVLTLPHAQGQTIDSPVNQPKKKRLEKQRAVTIFMPESQFRKIAIFYGRRGEIENDTLKRFCEQAVEEKMMQTDEHIEKVRKRVDR